MFADKKYWGKNGLGRLWGLYKTIILGPVLVTIFHNDGEAHIKKKKKEKVTPTSADDKN